MKKVLILTFSRDEHTHILVKEIEKLGSQVFRIDTDRLPTHFSLTLYPTNEKSYFTCRTPVGSFSSEDIFSVWIRRPYQLYDNTSDIYKKLIQQETFETMRSLPDLFDKKILLVDHPAKVHRASGKINQLILAKKIGMSIPPSIITMSENEAQKFIKAQKNDVIIKAIYQSFIVQKDKTMSIHTSKLNNNMNLKLAKNCPTFFQKNIKKKTELRITIIGKKVFAVEFDSQKYPQTSIDCRKDVLKILKTPHRVVKLPDKLERKLLALLDHYGLNFGAIDMARTPDDDYIFFELNPAGQFLWLEDLTSLPLASEMAKFLLGIKD